MEIGNTATIGRSRENTISLHTNPHVSRQHAVIRCHNAYQFQITDLGSRNGTFVNGRRVITPTILTHGAVIRITNNELIFEQSDEISEDTTFDVTLAAGPESTHDQSAVVAVMVCDIRGFSTVSELLSEDELARTLGQWFRDVGNIVHKNGGTIDKFIGDAVLAYWTRESSDGERIAWSIGQRFGAFECCRQALLEIVRRKAVSHRGGPASRKCNLWERGLGRATRCNDSWRHSEHRLSD